MTEPEENTEPVTEDPPIPADVDWIVHDSVENDGSGAMPLFPGIPGPPAPPLPSAP